MPKASPKTYSQEPPRSFNVTQVIGTVDITPHGELSPDLAAYQIIAKHDTPGTYTFPNIYGADTTVDIATPEQPVEVDDNDAY